jgi:hypothetical protein
MDNYNMWNDSDSYVELKHTQVGFVVPPDDRFRTYELLNGRSCKKCLHVDCSGFGVVRTCGFAHGVETMAEGFG